MAINVIGFRWGDSDENHKYDYEALENKPSTDLGVLDIDTTAEQGTDDGDLYRAIHSFSWDSVINTLSGILNVKKLFTNIVNQVKSNKDKLDDPGQILEDGIGSLSTASSVINSDRFIIKENDGSIKQVTPLSTLRGGVRNLTTVVSFLDRFIPTISTSDASEINKAPVSSVVRAGIYNLASGSASDLNENLSDSIVVQTEAEAGALDPAYVEKHTLSEIHDLFGIDDLKTTVSGHTTRLTTAESNITTLQSTKVDMTTPQLNLDTSQSPGTTDGDLYAAIDALGWSALISNQLLELKGLLTNALTELKKFNSITRIDSPYEIENASVISSIRTTDSYLLICGHLVYFTIRFMVSTATTGSTTAMKFKDEYSQYLPNNYGKDNGIVVPCTKVWTGGSSGLLYINATWKIGLSGGLLANSDYLASGTYII